MSSYLDFALSLSSLSCLLEAVFLSREVLTSFVLRRLVCVVLDYLGHLLFLLLVFCSCPPLLPTPVAALLEGSALLMVESLSPPRFCTHCRRPGHLESDCYQKQRGVPPRAPPSAPVTTGFTEQDIVRLQRLLASSGSASTGTAASAAVSSPQSGTSSWVLDSGASFHMSPDSSSLSSLRTLTLGPWLGLALGAVTPRDFGSLTGFMFLLPPLPRPLHACLLLPPPPPFSSGTIVLVIFVVLACHLYFVEVFWGLSQEMSRFRVVRVVGLVNRISYLILLVRLYLSDRLIWFILISCSADSLTTFSSSTRQTPFSSLTTVPTLHIFPSHVTFLAYGRPSLPFSLLPSSP
ncbi:hypothetical protein QYE76_044180 [Lolium multiflorum]|uniref:CCHC-type domain-containing protein n=1 Tax=Lolium multiflorum TaxID=4521 RepID=A0AAD8TKF9_LOLMU|nr:hypothetical protein QYE76_044180 [Lolium multiflorum]